jgi:hypothetical protein
MSFTYQALIFFHVSVGFASLILFWIPVVAKKGSTRHKLTGHWYAKAMYAVGVSAFILSMMLMVDPISFKFSDQTLTAAQALKIESEQGDIGLFLLAISVLVMVGVRHGLQTIRSKGNHVLMRRTDSLLINLALLMVGICLGVTATGNSPMNVLFYIFAALCSVTALGNLRYCLKHQVTRGEQIIAHLSAIIGAGIGAHTAFFVFGASRVLNELLTGYYMLVPWVLPGVVGTLLIFIQAKKYRSRKPKINPLVARAKV